MKYTLNSKFLTKRVEVALVGCGGTGSMLLTELSRTSVAMRSLGHPEGLHVKVFDPDRVSESNIGRQLFYSADKGQFKATVLVNRLNLAYTGKGIQWEAVPEKFPSQNHPHYRPDIVISCVDTRTARREIAKAVSELSVPLWLDCGNGNSDGQVILGEPKGKYESPKQRPMRLPTVVDLYPDLLDESIQEDDDTPTCSLAEALERQDLFINRTISTFASEILWTLFRKGGIDHHGAFINLSNGPRVTPLPVDPEAWKRFLPAKKRRPRVKKAALAA